MFPACPNCGAALDDFNSFDVGVEDVEVNVSMYENEYGPYLKAHGPDEIDASFTVSCMHCWWWMEIRTSAQLDVDSKVDHDIAGRLKPTTESPLYDDATEMWATPKKARY